MHAGFCNLKYIKMSCKGSQKEGGDGKKNAKIYHLTSSKDLAPRQGRLWLARVEDGSGGKMLVAVMEMEEVRLRSGELVHENYHVSIAYEHLFFFFASVKLSLLTPRATRNYTHL